MEMLMMANFSVKKKNDANFSWTFSLQPIVMNFDTENQIP